MSSTSFGKSRFRSTQTGLPDLLTSDSYTRIAQKADLRDLQRRIASRLHLETDQSGWEAYEAEWRAPKSISEEIQELEGRLKDRNASRSDLAPMISALKMALPQPSRRTAEVQEDGQVCLASLSDLPDGFDEVGGGFYRQGHSIWELRSAEDEEGGYVLARRIEERAVDLRPTASRAPTKTAETWISSGRSLCPSCLPRGSRVATVVNGQMIPVIVMEVSGDEATVQDDAGQQMQSPMDMLVTDMTVQMPGLQEGGQDENDERAKEIGYAVLELVDPAAAEFMQPGQPLMPGAGGSAISEFEQMLAPPSPAVEMAPVQVGPAGCDCDRGCDCPCHNGKSVKKKGPVQGMDPKVEPSSKDPDAQSERTAQVTRPGRVPEPSFPLGMPVRPLPKSVRIPPPDDFKRYTRQELDQHRDRSLEDEARRRQHLIEEPHLPTRPESEDFTHVMQPTVISGRGTIPPPVPKRTTTPPPLPKRK